SFTLAAVNDAPALTGTPATLAGGSEDTAYTVSAASLLAGYSDVEGSTLSVVTLTSDHGSVVDNGDGTYTITPTANYNGTVALSYGVSDGTATTAATQSFTLAAVNDAPVVTAGQSFSVVENQTAVGTVVATDVDALDTRTFALSGNGADDGLFNISSTGVLSFKTAPDFENANHSPAYSVSVVATDAAKLASSAQTVTVNVTDTAPLLKAANAFATVAENTVGSIGNVNATGGDTSSVSYTISGSNDGRLFAIDADGNLSFANPPNFEAPGSVRQDNNYRVTVLATDDSDNTTARTYTIAVTNVNEAPVVTAGQSFSVAENQTAVGTVAATDVDASDTRTFALSGNGADDGLFNISSAGVLSFKTAPDFENASHTPAYSVSVVATDAAGLASSAQTVAVNVTDVNESNVLVSSIPNSRVIGGSGNDLFIAYANGSTLDGGNGNDTVSYQNLAVGVIIDLAGQSSYDGTAGDAFISIENATGSTHDDALIAGSGPGVLQGLAGNDYFYASANGSSIDGGAGNDTVSYERSSVGVIIDLAAHGSYNGTAGDAFISIENAIGSTHNDALIAGNASTLTGGAGNDTFDFVRGTGAVHLTDFISGQDLIQFSTGQFADFAAVMANSYQDGANTVIQVHENGNSAPVENITVENVVLANLNSSDFRFV
ncbi:tandem-95 repeat protein, partial [Methylobacterium sp. WL122]